MKIFLITPVRSITEEFRAGVCAHLLSLEQQGHEVYYPPRDTNQRDRTGYTICYENMQAIKAAELVEVCWDGKSQGCLFDLGMAFALGKDVRAAIGLFPRMTKGKSFASMVYAWEERWG